MADEMRSGASGGARRASGPRPPSRSGFVDVARARAAERDGLVLSVAQVRELDHRCEIEYAIPPMLLMEHAALGARAVALGMIRRDGLAGAIIACGPGNNGGDGLALARLLHIVGVPVEVVLALPARRCGELARMQLDMVRALGLPVRVWRGAGDRLARSSSRVLLVDALLGTGLSRPLVEPFASLAVACCGCAGTSGRGEAAKGIHKSATARSCRTLALDIPTGLDADSGEISAGGVAVRADATVTFAAIKPGLRTRTGRTCAGRVYVASIGAPPALLAALSAGGSNAREGGISLSERRSHPQRKPTR